MAVNSSPIPARLLSRHIQFFKPAQVRCYSAPVSGSIPASKQKYIPTSGTYPKGFSVSGTYVGVKASNTGTPDLAFIASEGDCVAAAVFTRNKFRAAPVVYSKKTLVTRDGKGVNSVIINSGCANAVTGKGGLEDAARMGATADECLKAEDDGKGPRSLVMSTGVIGQRLPIDKILKKIPEAHAGLGSTHDHWMAAAKAICTTDTFPKLLSRTFSLPSSPGVEFRIAGMTKGAGMIHPNMATLLGVIATDAPIADFIVRGFLKQAVNRSFNSISIDGDTSTNDTVALFANGAAAAGVKPIVSRKSEDGIAFQKVLTDFSADLAKLVVRDGEGATKFVTIRVTNCLSEDAGRKIASTIARSPLVKTALYGKDANWGRILCAVGYSQIPDYGVREKPNAEMSPVQPEKVSVSFIPTDGSPELKLLVNGEPEAVDEARAAEILQHEDLEIKVDLAHGTEEAVFWTCDFSHEYVTINGDYRT